MRDEARVIEGASIEVVMRETGRRARGSSRALALATPAMKTAALMGMADEIRRRRDDILQANAEDCAEAAANGATLAYIDRLKLDAARVEGIAKGVEAIAMLPDPVGRVIASWERPNGLKIERVSTPLGVIGIIYESRPNVTADAGALSLKSGNACILRGGSDSFRSSEAIILAMREALHESGLPEDGIQLVPTRDRAAVGLMLAGLEGRIDVIVPRGGKSLVARVQAEARVPVFAHLEGINHVFVERTADLDMAKRIVLNAKMRRVSVCGAMETLLVDRACAQTHLVPLVEMLKDAGCEVRGDTATRTVFPNIAAATEADWSTEYLDAIISVKVVNDLDEAIAHVEAYGSHHTDAIVTENPKAAERFLNEVDSAIVLWNASTQFADGGEFGFGGEIGISTGRMHARGPVGAEQLCSFKYRVLGTGQTRP